MCRVRLCPREGTERFAKHLDPITGLGCTGEILALCGIFAHMCSKHLHTRNSYSNLFPCISYGDAWFKNKCAFWWESAMQAKCIFILQFQRWENHFWLFLPVPLRPHTNCSFVSLGATSFPSETFHIWLLLHVLSQEGQHIFHHRRQAISLHALLPLTQGFASTCSQSAGVLV